MDDDVIHCQACYSTLFLVLNVLI